MAAEDGGWGAIGDEGLFNSNFSFDPSTGILTENTGQSESGSPVSLTSQYGPTAWQPMSDFANTPGGFFGAIDYLAATGQINQGGGGFWGGLDDWATQNGWMIPLAMATAGAGAALGGAGVAAEGGLETAGAGGLSGGGGFVPAAGSGANFGIDAGATYGVAGGAGGGSMALPSTSWVSPQIGGGATGSSYGSLTAPLSGSGAVPGAGATTLGSGGLTGALPSGVMVGDGTLGTTMGATYMAAAPGQFAVDAFGSAIPASSIGAGGYAPSTSLSDALKTANQVKKGVSTANDLAKMLSQGASSGLASSLGKFAQGANSQGQALTPFVHGNTNPFTYTAQQPIQNAKPLDLASLANLLKQG